MRESIFGVVIQTQNKLLQALVEQNKFLECLPSMKKSSEKESFTLTFRPMFDDFLSPNKQIETDLLKTVSFDNAIQLSYHYRL